MRTAYSRTHLKEQLFISKTIYRLRTVTYLVKSLVTTIFLYFYLAALYFYATYPEDTYGRFHPRT